jgi:KDO2-lipid IV(A) lauroyltransferase
VDVPVGALRAASSLLRVTPGPVAGGVARAIAAGIAAASPDERLIAARNMRRAHAGERLGPMRTRLAVRRVFDSYARYWLDALRLPDLDDATIEAGFTYEGMHHLRDAVEAGTPPILALPHLGGWEWAARWLSVQGWEVAAVVEALDDGELYEWFVQMRRQLGLQIIPLGPHASAEVAASLAAGRIMCLLADRDISGGGIEVDFFGERTRLPGGPALMALRTGVPLLPTAVYFRGRRCHALIDPPLDTARRGRLREDVTRITQELAHCMERLIRRAPEQWHLLQPNWPSDYLALGRPVPGEAADPGAGDARR